MPSPFTSPLLFQTQVSNRVKDIWKIHRPHILMRKGIIIANESVDETITRKIFGQV